VEHTNYMDISHYGGDHLVYLGDYLPATHRYFQMTKEELEDTFFPTLTKFNPAFDRSWVRKTWLHREAYAQPVVKINHSQNIPAMATPIANLYFASMAQVYPWDRGTNYAVELGKRAAALVLQG
jgi:protoporphyrinogen oxidase